MVEVTCPLVTAVNEVWQHYESRPGTVPGVAQPVPDWVAKSMARSLFAEVPDTIPDGWAE